MTDADRVSLIIGMDVYDDKKLPALPSCKKDAIDTHNVLSSIGFTGFNNSPLIGSEIANEKFSGAILRDTISRFFSEAKPGQMLLFYFSGHGIHGGSELYMGAPDIDSNSPRSRGFSLEDLRECIGESHSRRIIAIIDACYSGRLNLPDNAPDGVRKKAGEDSVKQAQDKYDEAIKNFFPKKRRERHFKQTALLLASQSFEQANAPIDGNNNSMYTQFFLEGIRGVRTTFDINGNKVYGSIDEDGNVTPQSLHRYVSYQVESIDPSQTPKFKCDESNEPIILATYSEKVKPPKASDESEEPAKSTLTNPYFVNIKKREKKIKDVCVKFLKLYTSRKDTNNVDETRLIDDEIEKTSSDIKALYVEAERIKDEAAFLTRNYDMERIEQDSYVKKMSCLAERMVQLEFELDKNVSPKLERAKRHLLAPEPQSIPSKSNQQTTGESTLITDFPESSVVSLQEEQVPDKTENVDKEYIHLRILKTMKEAKERMDLNKFAVITGLSAKDIVNELESMKNLGLIRKIGNGFGMTEKGKAELIIKTSSLKNTACEVTEIKAKSVDTIPLNVFGKIQTLEGHNKSVRSCAWSPGQGIRIASGSDDGTLKIWDTKSGSILKTITKLYSVVSCDWSPDGKYVIGAGYIDKVIKLWDASSGEWIKTFRVPSGTADFCIFSPDGTRILSAGGNMPIIWDVNSGEELQVLKGHKYSVYAGAWSPDGTRVVTGGGDWNLKVWEANTGKELQTLMGHGHRINSCDWSPDGTSILSGSKDKTLKIWHETIDLKSPTAHFHEFCALEGHKKEIKSCAWSPDGRYALSASNDKTLKIWDAKTGKWLQDLLGHEDEVYSCDWSPDGKRIISGSKDRKIRIWEEGPSP